MNAWPGTKKNSISPILYCNHEYMDHARPNVNGGASQKPQLLQKPIYSYGKLSAVSYAYRLIYSVWTVQWQAYIIISVSTNSQVFFKE